MNEMVGWHHQLNGHEFEQTPGDSEGQGCLTCCSLWGHKESDTIELLNNNNSKNKGWLNNRNPFLAIFTLLYGKTNKSPKKVLVSEGSSVESAIREEPNFKMGKDPQWPHPRR